MDIIFTNNGNEDCTEIIIKIFPDATSETFGPGLQFIWVCDTVIERIAMEKYLRDRFHAAVERITRQAYNCGWDDHRKKRKKKTDWFPMELSEEFEYND